MTISSADPDDLGRYVAAGRELNDRARRRAGALIAQYEAYAAKPCDFPVSASDALAGLRRWVELNGQDDRWVETVARAFQTADAGGPALADDAAIAALLARNGVPDGPRAAIAGVGVGVGVASVPASRDPAVIARWWESLDPGRRTALLADDPKLIGGLAGVPARWRDKANRIALRQRIEALAAERDAVAVRVAALEGLVRSGGADLAATVDLLAAQRRLADIARRLAGCVNLERQLVAVAREPSHRLRAADVYLLDFDADFAGGDGRAVVALGDPGTADHVGVVVPGTGSTLRNVEGPLSNAARLRATVDESLGGSAAAGRTATVMWLGYDAPDSIPDAADKREAETGGPALGGFVGELRAAHDGSSRPHVSVFGPQLWQHGGGDGRRGGHGRR